ncbi:DUF2238 domain-containing protein [Microbacterium sp. JZ31]|uniref:DUF2238 domain-containing protein n=1 Tax=Microbacterium sp. JZ31 TaxID=1906274 RepID=UPI0019348B86|nr:DUF2238 domain-containing protein [Microbacterium sp. JZ31]
MIERFLRPPATPGEWIADAVRVLGVVSVFVAGFGWDLTDAGIIAIGLPALVLPRFLGVRAGFDILYGISVLVASWSNVLGLYRSVPGWDLLVHFECTGVLALMLFVLAARTGVVPGGVGAGQPARVPIVLVGMTGLAISAVWEMIEWFGYTFVSDAIYVAYVDTIGDMAAGGLGALLAGVIASRMRVIELS